MELHDQEWYSVSGYAGYYQITKTGRIRSVTRLIPHGKGQRICYSKEIKTRKNNHGYIEVRLSKESVTKTHFLHRLLAQTFIPNPLKKKEVNHKNGFKTDNRLSNLEWCMHDENVKHAYKTGIMNKKPKPVFDLILFKIWKNEKDVSMAYGLPLKLLMRYLNSKPSRVLFSYIY